MKRCIAMFLTSCCLAANVASAQSVSAPVAEEGNTWEFQTVDLWSGKMTSRLTRKTIGVSGEYARMMYETTDVGKAGEFVKPRVTEGTMRADLNFNVMYRGEKLERIAYKWPLEPGKKWSYQIKEDLPLAANATVPQVVTTNTDVEVKGWESIEVPAGKFKVLKLQYKNSWSTENPASKGITLATTWYCPEIKTIVQSTFESFGADGSPQTRTRDQLVRYSAK
jgi:hypothetical protein